MRLVCVLVAMSVIACTGPRAPGAAPAQTVRASGTTAAGSDDVCGPRDARLIVRFRTEVDRSVRREHGITAGAFARAVLSVLCDARGWLRSDMVRFRHDPDGPYVIGLRNRRNVKERCEVLVGEPVSGNYSCASSAYKEVVINEGPWYDGTPGFPGDLRMYRRMLIDHEVGHVMTLRHRSCPGDDRKAPVMMQQSKGLTVNGNTCKANPWPRPFELDSL
jgi:hypothetical protein